MTQQQDSPQMFYTDTIDLRPYLLDLLNAWKILIGIPLLVGVLAAVYFVFFDTTTYEATSLVAVTEASFNVAVTTDSQIRTNDDLTSSFGAYPELALSDTLISSLYNDPDLISLWPNEIYDSAELKKQLNSGTGADPSLIRLTATFVDQELPSLVVNRWSELFIETLNEVYGTRSAESLAILETQLGKAALEKELAEAELAEFEGVNRASILANQLAVYTSTQVALTQELQDLNRIQTDLLSMEQQLETNPDAALDPIALFLLQLRVYGSNELQALQIETVSLGDQEALSGNEADTVIDGMLAFVETKEKILQADLDAVEPNILVTQKELALSQQEKSNLQKKLSLVVDTHDALAIKVEEEQVTANVFAGQIRLASGASQAVQVSGGGATTTVILTIVIGLLLVGFVVLRRWWADLFADSV